MENHRNQKDGWMSVPQFGGWDQNSAAPDYSMVFQRARANRKHHKVDIKRASLGNESELIVYQDPEDSISKRKRLLSYLNCCIRA